MGERKVLNNYIPPDFDPSIIPKFKRSKDRIQEIRMMLPFSMQCNTCGEYLYKGKKFNSKKEDCKGEDYMGIRRFRFYIKCSVCSAEIAFKTDPKNSDYECESGATRNFEVWRDAAEAQEEVNKEREEEDEHDTMKALENRTLDSKLEMDVLDALDEIKAINQRHERVDTTKVLAALQKANTPAATATDGLTAADEELIKSIKFKSKQSESADDESTLNSKKSDTQSNADSSFYSANSHMAALLQKQLTQQKPVAAKPVVVVKKRKVDAIAPAGATDTTSAHKDEASKKSNTTASVAGAPAAATVSAPAVPAAAAVNSMFADYGEDSD